MALKGGKLTDAEKETIENFAKTGGVAVMPLVAATLNRSEKVVMEHVETLTDVKPAESPSAAPLQTKPQVAVVNGVTSPATNKEQGVAIMTRAASEHGDARRPFRKITAPSHIAACKRNPNDSLSPAEIQSQISELQAKLEQMKQNGEGQNG